MSRDYAVPHITVDARMLGSSGIGTYIAELLPRVVRLMDTTRFTLLGREAALREVVPASDQVRYKEFVDPIYSIREQFGYLRVIPWKTTLVWTPHFNIPLAYRGVLVATVHDVSHLAIRQSTLARRLYARVMFGAVRRRAHIILCESRFTACEFTRLVGAPKAMVIAPLGVAPTWTPLEDDLRDEREPYFLYVGNVKPHKNLVRLLDAFEALPADIPHRLVIVGQNEGLRTIDSDVMQRVGDLGERVEMTGHVPQHELLRLVRGCDALVLPSLSEGFGLPPLEALACGRPVAVSAAASLPEVCGPMAEYFDPVNVTSITDALARVARRPPDTAQTIAQRTAWARRFDWENCAKETAAALANALARTRN